MTSKTTNLLYWIFTILFAGLMAFSAVPNLLTTPKSVQFMNGMLGYPVYIIPFIGLAKLLGVIAILIPGLKKIKEWAYAELFFAFCSCSFRFYFVAPCLELQAFRVMAKHRRRFCKNFLLIVAFVCNL